MKKFLSLVLALVMTMSLVTVGAGAKDFDDNADITYVEAVDVMSDLKIVDGDVAGNFNPTNGLTRGAAAKIVCNLILGPTTAAELNADTNPFPDVDKDSTFAGYIAYCAKEGIIGGYADGTFKPAAPLTGYAFMKMLLGALGYDAAVEGYGVAGTVEPNWSINVAKQAIGIGLNAGLVDDFNGSDYVTREEAMLYAFNTMKATMVDYDTTITIGDITVAGSNEYAVANNARTETIKEDNKMQFAEKYFTKLSLDTTVEDWAGRPCNEWTYDKEVVGTYVDYTLMVAEYTTGVAGKNVYAKLGKNVVENYEFEVLVDGVVDNDLVADIVKNNNSSVAESGNGVLIQMFVDKETETVSVAVINTYLAFAASDYSAKKDTLSLEIYDDATYFLDSVKGEDFAIAVDAVEDDAFLVTYDFLADEVVSIVAAEIVADTEIEGFSKGSSLTVDGEDYKYSKKAAYDSEVLALYTGTGDTNLKDITYNVYLDTYGYVIGVDEVTAPDNYVFITAVDENYSNLVTKTFDANAIFMDGTSAVIEVKNDADFRADLAAIIEGDPTDDTDYVDPAVINTWFTYTVSSSGVYTLDVVADSIATGVKVAQYSTVLDNETIDKKNISLPGHANANNTYYSVYGNDATIYLSADLDEVLTATYQNNVIVGVDAVTTGVRNASIELDSALAVDGKNVFTLYKDNGYVIAAVVVGEDGAATKNLVYVNNNSVDSEKYNKTTGMWTWTLEVILDGEKVVLTETNDEGVSVLEAMANAYATALAADARVDGIWYQVKYKADGTVHTADAIVDDSILDGYITTWGGIAAEIAAEDLVLLDDAAIRNNDLSLVGNTLFFNTTNVRGVFVSDDVKVVLTQKNNNQTTTSCEVGVKALKAVLDELNDESDSNTANDFWFNAIIEDGAVTAVVIKDLNDDGYTSNSGSTVVAGYEGEVVISTRKVNVTGPAAWDENDADLKDAIVATAVNALADEGYEVTSMVTTGDWMFTVKNLKTGTDAMQFHVIYTPDV